MVSLRSWSRLIATITLILMVICLGLLIDDELRINTIATELTMSDNPVVNALMRTKRTLRISIAVESILLISLITLVLYGIGTYVRRPLNELRRNLHLATQVPEHVITKVGPREIAEVAVDAEQLRRSLVDKTDLADQSVHALTLEAPATSAIRATLDRKPAAVDGILGYCRPIEGVIAGDWWWTAQRKDGSRVLAIADVSGHGIQAGVMAIESRAIVATALSSMVPLAEVARGLARHHWESGMFLTLFMVVINDGSLEYCSCGSQFAVIANKSNSTALLPTGPIISNLNGVWHSTTVEFSDDDLLVVATDGLTEASTDHQVSTWIEHAWQQSPSNTSELLEVLLAHARQGSTQWNDDLTVILATGNSRGEFP